MIINVNDKTHEVAVGTSLDILIKSLDIQMQGVAVAVNLVVIPKNEWSKTILTDGMSLMLIHAVSGG